MAKQQKVEWFKLDIELDGLEPNVEHEVEVCREAIPIIFVPGIMGSHLRRSDTKGEGDADDLPNLRWNPSDGGWMWDHLVRASPARRRLMLVNTPERHFDPHYLEVDEDNPPGDGFRGIFTDYHEFLNLLRETQWGEISKIFTLPVYACGFNWTADVRDCAAALLKRVDDIIAEAKAITGLCDKVILISHSMGGLVCRTASEVLGGRGRILGIVHGVQPVNGTPAAYWRIKAGFEGFDKFGFLQKALGNSGPKVTVILGNIPGGLELLPNKLYRSTADRADWLHITEDGTTLLALPRADPYEEIYRVKAEVHPKKGENPSTNTYWGLIDPALLNPRRVVGEGNEFDGLSADEYDPWANYLGLLKIAETLHDDLSPPTGPKQHPQTLCISGTGRHTATVVELRLESNWGRSDPYPNQGFRGLLHDDAGHNRQAVLQDPADDGDGTVPLLSAIAVDVSRRPLPGDRLFDVGHQSAYSDAHVRRWAEAAIRALCKYHFYERRKPAAGGG